MVRQTINDQQRSFTSMATTHPKKIESRSFNYSNDYNSQMIRAGRSINYPGQTETADRFIQPKHPSHTASFTVAQPDFTRIGRPLARLVSQSSCSEYIDRYTFPDSSNMERYPWLRP